MRITDQMIAETTIQNLENSQTRLSQLSNQLTSGQQMSQMSDNPTAAAQVLSLSTNLSLNNQYLSNADSAAAWLGATGAALSGVSAALQNANQFAVQGANDTLTASDRQSLATEVTGLIGEVAQLGNSTYAGSYIFAGAQTTTAPFTDASGTVSFNNSDPTSATTPLERVIGPGTSVVVNVVGHDPAGNSAVFDQVFGALTSLNQALQSNNTSAIQASITQLASAQQTVTQAQAQVGGNQNQVSATQNQLNALQLSLTQASSTLSNTDLAQAATLYAEANTVQQAAVAAASKSFPPSLFSFMA